MNSAASPGRIERALIRLLMRPSTVTAVEVLSPHFRLVDLAGDALRGVAWSPGQKLQIMLNGLRTARTYTPICWDEQEGRTRLLAWSHGEGPGSQWAENVTRGDSCQFFGPRRSLDVSGLAGPIVLFGDETSFALAAALSQTRDGALHLLFEVSDIQECGPVLQTLGMGHAILVERAADDRHLSVLEDRLRHIALDDAGFVLTGRAPAIQTMSRALKGVGIGSSRTRTKAYWAPGKVGLD
ncbi:siderophore-interacting protein [Sphingomonas sp.]|uniref:siderophore-interacting protein n=1 Tax=Sphingomonas sp. TaxID=28214 RepID=UPI003D6D0547